MDGWLSMQMSFVSLSCVGMCLCEWVHHCTRGGDDWLNRWNNGLLVGNLLPGIPPPPPPNTVKTHTIHTASPPNPSWKTPPPYTHARILPVCTERVHCLQEWPCQRGHTNWDVPVMINTLLHSRTDFLTRLWQCDNMVMKCKIEQCDQLTQCSDT